MQEMQVDLKTKMNGVGRLPGKSWIRGGRKSPSTFFAWNQLSLPQNIQTFKALFDGKTQEQNCGSLSVENHHHCNQSVRLETVSVKWRQKERQRQRQRQKERQIQRQRQRLLCCPAALTEQSTSIQECRGRHSNCLHYNIKAELFNIQVWKQVFIKKGSVWQTKEMPRQIIGL